MSSHTFYPGRLRGVAMVPPAKSEAHRALLLAALGQGVCRLHGFTPPLCDDTLAMMAGVSALGATVCQEGDSLCVIPAPLKTHDGEVSFHVHACAAALRMLIPAFWVRGQAVRITMEDALFARPLDALQAFAREAGVSLRAVPSQGDAPAYVALEGRLCSGSYRIDGGVSSQYASGLLIALSHAFGEAGEPAACELLVRTPIVSRPYLDMTLRMMAQFSAEAIEAREGCFALPGQARKNPSDIEVTGDWSQGAVLLCASAMGNSITVGNLRLKPKQSCLQGDAYVVSLLRQMGMQTLQTNDGLRMVNPSRAKLLPLDVNCENIPDLVPILALTLTQAGGISTLRGVRRLRVKECDRLSATVELLGAMGARASVSKCGDILSVQGPTRLKGGFHAESRGDHRMVMLLVVAALIADAPIRVNGVEAISKSWPGFLDTCRSLGGHWE